MLTLALACTGVAALTNWSTRVRPRARLETVSKPLTTVFVMWVAFAANGPTNATVLAVLALGFCLVGDIALLDIVDRFIVGLGAFLVGHLLFIAMAVSLHLDRPWWAAVAVVVVVLLAKFIAVGIITSAALAQPKLKWPVIAYFVVISSMAIVATATGNWWVIAGAWAFVISDSLLGRREFVRDQRWMALGVMVTYHAALVGLALGLHR